MSSLAKQEPPDSEEPTIRRVDSGDEKRGPAITSLNNDNNTPDSLPEEGDDSVAVAEDDVKYGSSSASSQNEDEVKGKIQSEEDLTPDAKEQEEIDLVDNKGNNGINDAKRPDGKDSEDGEDVKRRSDGKRATALSSRSKPPTHLKPFYKGQWLDVLDTDNNWLEATVIGLNNDLKTITIHYLGWKSDFDESLCFKDNNDNWSRMAPLHTHTKRPITNYPEINFEVGMRVDTLDSVGKWLVGIIRDLDIKHSMVRVHFEEWNDKFDEWINCDSYRLAPLYTHAPKPKARPPPLRRGESKYHVDTNSESRWRARMIEERKLRISDQAGDGNCLFRSVAHQIYGDPEQHTVVRKKAMQYIESQKAFFEQFVDGEDIDDYIHRMKGLGEWGGDIEIQAMAEIYDRPITVYAYNVDPMRTYWRHSTNPPIRLSYHFRSHYNSVVSIDSATQTTSWIQYPPGEWEDERIANIQRLGRAAVNMGDSKGNDDSVLLLHLRAQREIFDFNGVDAFDAAIAASLREHNSLTEEEKLLIVLRESEREDIQRQLNQMGVSTTTTTTSAADPDDDMKRAIEASMQTVNTSPTSDMQAAINASLASSQDAAMEAALQASLAEHQRNQELKQMAGSDQHQSIPSSVKNRLMMEMGIDERVILLHWDKIVQVPGYSDDDYFQAMVNRIFA